MNSKKETDIRELSNSIESLAAVNSQLVRLLSASVIRTSSSFAANDSYRWQPTLDDLLEFFRGGGGALSVENWKTRFVERQQRSCELNCNLEELRAREEVFRCRLDAVAHGYPTEFCDELEAHAEEQAELCRQACRDRIQSLKKRLGPIK